MTLKERAELLVVTAIGQVADMHGERRRLLLDSTTRAVVRCSGSRVGVMLGGIVRSLPLAWLGFGRRGGGIVILRGPLAWLALLLLLLSFGSLLGELLAAALEGLALLAHDAVVGVEPLLDRAMVALERKPLLKDLLRPIGDRVARAFVDRASRVVVAELALELCIREPVHRDFAVVLGEQLEHFAALVQGLEALGELSSEIDLERQVCIGGREIVCEPLTGLEVRRFHLVVIDIYRINVKPCE